MCIWRFWLRISSGIKPRNSDLNSWDTLYTVTQFDYAMTPFRHLTCTTITAYIHVITSRKPHCSHFVPHEQGTYTHCLIVELGSTNLSRAVFLEHRIFRFILSRSLRTEYPNISVVRSTNMANKNSKPTVPNMVDRLAPEFGWPDGQIKVRELVDACTPYTTCHMRDFRLRPRCKWCLRLVVIYRGFDTACPSNLQQSSSPRRWDW
jgi:hypothetical protein